MTMHAWFRLLVFVIGLCAAPRVSDAQLAPTGAHYAARSSDTGFSGPSDSGSYSTSVPLELPPARGGLPVPVQIVSGTHGYGAVGIGWDIPYSYVYVDDTLAHRRPALGDGFKAIARQHITVSLMGRSADMMFHGDNGGMSTWIGRNAADLELRHQGGANEISVYDGNGLTYVFTQFPELAYTDHFSGLWLLRRIDGPGHASVALEYTVGTYTMPMPGVPPAAMINLVKVSYNRHPTSDCYKNEVALIYETSSGTQPYQALQILGERLLVRRTRVAEIHTMSRRTCGADAEVLRTYAFHYAPDRDTQLDRLQSVDVLGRPMPEGRQQLPVARYEYGTATTQAFSGPALSFDGSGLPAIALPPGAKEGIAWTERQSSIPFQLPPVASHPAATLQNLIDMTGDGRPDLVFSENGRLMIARNIATANGVEFAPKVPLTDTTFRHGALDVHSFRFDRFAGPKDSHANEDLVWTQTIDVNGDGRLDVIDAARKPGVWLIFLNTPDPTAPSGIKWNRRAVDVSGIIKELKGRGWEVPGNYLPLSRRVTARDHERETCWVRTDAVDAFGRHIYKSRPDYVRASWGEHPYCNFYPEAGKVFWTGTEKTFTEWQLQDINGDGYPDFVWNEHPALLKGTTSSDIENNNDETYGYEYVTFGLHDGSSVLGAYNVRGVFIGGDLDLTKPPVDPFSAPVELAHDNAGCGVEKWAAAEFRDDMQVMECGFLDMNGDGISDRYVAVQGFWYPLSVSIGNGSYFNTARFAAPHIARQENNYDEHCAKEPQDVWYASEQTSAVRDVTGDGFPDLIERRHVNGAGRWRISPGTAAGFDTQHTITTDLTLSRVDEECSGRASRTAAGLIDLDGDGQPEIVSYSGGKLTMSPLRNGNAVGRHAAGRLTVIDSGTGSMTSITYRSAKTDYRTQHQIPSPEVVVDSIKTIGHGGPLSDDIGHVFMNESLGGDLVKKQFAYGNISLFFDPAFEAFRPTGYLQRIELSFVPAVNDKTTGQATVTESYGLETYATGQPVNERLARYLKVGRPKRVTVLAGFLGIDAWALLGSDYSSDTRRIAGSDYVTGINNSRVFRDVILTSEDQCTDMVYPYDFDASTAIANTFPTNAYQPCKQRGFLWTDYTSTWRGQLAPPAIANVQTAWSVKAVDDYGRVTSIYIHNDEYRSDDDYCIDTTFAIPVSEVPRNRNAPYARRIYTCSKEGSTLVLGEESWEYDKQAPGLVAAGIPTSHTIYLHATDTGEHLRTIREMDISLDAAGNPRKIVRTREDGATRTVGLSYDEFGLAATYSSFEGTGVAMLSRTMDVDPLTEYVVSTTDENGTTSSTKYDGFDRPLLTKLRGPNGTPDGVIKAYAYLGFEGGDGLGRRIVTKMFTDPVAEQSIWTTEGHTSTTFLDELGRERYTSVSLGDDYANQALIVGAKKYDIFGRVTFSADPYPSTQDAATAYGTSVLYNIDGSVAAEIRGNGPQTLKTTDPTAERFPTVYTYQFTNHVQQISVQGPDELLSGTPQYGVSRQTTLSATGRTLSRATYLGTNRLEYADFGYDRLGNLSRLSRYLIPSTAAVPNDWTYRFDSQGATIEVREPDVAPQARLYSDFGELKHVTFGGIAPYATRVVANKYDALGRVTESHEENDGVINDETAVIYQYDDAPPTQLGATNLHGRLASARAKTSTIDLSYDAFGNVNGRRFVDSTQREYFERHEYHADGSPSSLTLQLPDNGYSNERVQFSYDSAGRARWISFDDGINTQELYNASNVDAWGRVRNAKYSNTAIDYAADYYDVGRRLVRSTAVTTSTGSRRYSFDAFDAVGREKSRTERVITAVNDTTNTITNSETTGYDSLGRVSRRLSTANPYGPADWSFQYNPLGNLLRSVNNYAQGSMVKFQHLAPDHDRICSVGYWGNNSSNTCSFKYDDLGGVRFMPASDGSTRELDFYNSGAVRSIRNSFGNVARFAYDPFGRVGELNIYKKNDLLRSDRNIGDFVTVRVQNGNPASAKFIERKIPGPGVLMTRRGPNGPWIFEFGEDRGVRFAVDGDGNFTQDIIYSPFGIATNKGIGAGDPRFTTLQWNGGDGLDSLGIVQVGARLYDPVLGRFLSRDPLMIPRDATKTNPYAFAFNDPINYSDPSGADACDWVPACGAGSTTVGAAVGAALSGALAVRAWANNRPKPAGSAPSYPQNSPDGPGHANALAGLISPIGSRAFAGPNTGSLSVSDLGELWSDGVLLGSEDYQQDLGGLGDSIRAGHWGRALWNLKNLGDDVGNTLVLGGFKAGKFASRVASGLFRKTSNTGALSTVKELMSLKNVKRVADNAGIGFKGIKLRIVRDPNLIGRGYTGFTHPSGRVIELYPDAFRSTEDLVKTLGHERTHAYQLRVFGVPADSLRLKEMEDAAYGSEPMWWNYFNGN